MSWESVVSSLQKTSDDLLTKYNDNNTNTNSKVKKPIKNKGKLKATEELQIPLDTLLKVSRQLTSSIEDLENVLKERDISFNSNPLRNDEKINDLIPNTDIKKNVETGRPSTLPPTPQAPPKARGRGRPHGSTSSRNSSTTLASLPTTANTTITDQDNDEKEARFSSTSAKSSTSPQLAATTTTTTTTSSSSEKLITIGAKYGYPAPPPLSTYSGKIGRSSFTSVYNPSTPILPNSQVAYCQNGLNSVNSEWILCRVLKVLTETRFEIQDPEPDELHPQGQIFRANYKEVILVPLHLVSAQISKLKEYKVGTKVLAKYPETTTFYPAEMMASKNGNCMLRFEGEEEVNKLTTVDRVFVLPYPK